MLDVGPGATESALVVVVPEVEPVVARHRGLFDVSRSWGVPAHVTVLYPFVEPRLIDDLVLDAVRAVVGSVRPFECSFPRTGWFGDSVLWLAPEPAEPFRSMTGALWRAFPGCPPYGGVHDGVTPHLTVAEAALAGVDGLRSVEQDVRRELPVRTAVTEVTLLAGAPVRDSWRRLASFPLGGSG